MTSASKVQAEQGRAQIGETVRDLGRGETCVTAAAQRRVFRDLEPPLASARLTEVQPALLIRGRFLSVICRWVEVDGPAEVGRAQPSERADEREIALGAERTVIDQFGRTVSGSN